MNFKVHESVVAQVIWPLAAASAKNAPATAPTPRHVRYDQPVLTAAGPCELAWCLSATRARRAAASTQAGPVYIASGCSPSVGQLAKAGQPACTCQPRGERQLRRAQPPACQPTSQRRARPQYQPFWFTAGRHPQQRGTRPWPRRVLPALFLAGRGCGDVARLRQASLAPNWPRALEAGRGSQGRQTAGAPASAASNPRCPLCQRRPGEGGRLSRLVARQVLSRGRPPGPCTPRWRGGWRQRPAGWPAPLATPAPGAARALIP